MTTGIEASVTLVRGYSPGGWTYAVRRHLGKEAGDVVHARLALATTGGRA